MRQCPSCRTINSFSAPNCERCGLRFYKSTSRISNMTGTCLRIGGGAILLAAVAIIVLRMT
jgi:hypothetical protein